MRVLVGTSIRLLVVVAIVLALAAVPLLTVYRSRCREHGKTVTRWSFALPGHETRMRHCRKPKQGLDVVLDYFGLK